MGFVEILYPGIAGCVEACCGEDQDRGIDQQCEGEGDGGVQRRKSDRFALFRQGMSIIAGLNDA